MGGLFFGRRAPHPAGGAVEVGEGFQVVLGGRQSVSSKVSQQVTNVSSDV